MHKVAPVLCPSVDLLGAVCGIIHLQLLSYSKPVLKKNCNTNVSDECYSWEIHFNMGHAPLIPLRVYFTVTIFYPVIN